MTTMRLIEEGQGKQRIDFLNEEEETIGQIVQNEEGGFTLTCRDGLQGLADSGAFNPGPSVELQFTPIG